MSVYRGLYRYAGFRAQDIKMRKISEEEVGKILIPVNDVFISHFYS